ncbi:cell division protein FtsZ [Candidatus Pacearchaeota archaeon CG10_big_fil_rev_8_21_14_0_10_35_219]|nr:cell division protein FtsZ [Candidatus Pacearchaeota archaeon]OIO42751.1 MAG: cell division protein FtsZ [Candidatus Pacearchaeota archaeon CG1_02_35_32]PIO08219.1 MAG: cell division protein FtsZ [Candidatus Pacearchaeota archaeon CG10_big_fil_rev_8_21_14_0_10_35_219]PIY81729.1 MAG: cell division protein FtsZ [Candidatus Pacearchaeota archaeon CG_4_10_14_0_8_um_filter_35_169]PIZ80367.1 MAG: cell division protein FtsZ [Candidatus Pacearchaeota archaeon CG_4_10_14_0_2_um_filter_35_33]PJA69945
MVLDFAKEAIENADAHSINFDELRAGKANIKVFGAGGAGCNTITWLFNKGINGASVYGVNTDALHLSITKADEKILIGKELTRGLGCGGYPAKGREAAKESLSELKKTTSNADMVFVCAGMGGGTGTGAAPVIAQLAKESGSVVIGVVTMPFECEKARIDKAEFGLQELREVVDTAIVIDNNRLVDIAGNLPMEQAFAVANELVSTMIKGIVETITLPSLINLDYADVSSIMRNGDVAVIGVGEADSQSRVEEAVRQALTHPLLDVDYRGATGALIHITCGPDFKLDEFSGVGQLVTENLSPEAQVIIGARIDKNFGSKVRVITIMTGVKSPYVLGKEMYDEKAQQPEMSDLGIEVFR